VSAACFLLQKRFERCLMRCDDAARVNDAVDSQFSFVCLHVQGSSWVCALFILVKGLDQSGAELVSCAVP